MLPKSASIIICGAGIAGVSTAYYLSVVHGVSDILLIDERPPLTLTSDKSTEAYRNWWPGPDDAMIRLMNRSIDLLEMLANECDNRFLLNRRGYIYATCSPRRADEYRQEATLAEAQGAGPLRVHDGSGRAESYNPSHAEGYGESPEGADLILDTTMIHRHFPYLSENVIALLHTRRCGWFSGQQLGMYLLEMSRAKGAKVLTGKVTGVSTQHGRVSGVEIRHAGGISTIQTETFINAAGPRVDDVASLLGVTLPVFSERHLKVSFKDHRGIIPRDAPLVICDDPQSLVWSQEEEAEFSRNAELSWLLEPFPAGVHSRPEGGLEGDNILILWPYDAHETEVIFPVPSNDLLPEIAMRGMAALIPGLEIYTGQLPRPFIDGGYYTKTPENRLLSCPLPVSGAYVIGALSGFGLMASQAAAELVAAYVTGSVLPVYASAFSLQRYDDPAYQQMLADWGNTGQL